MFPTQTYVFKKPIIVYDGQCNLCNGLIRFIKKHDTNNTFYMASRNEEFSNRLLFEKHFPKKETDSIILIDNSGFYIKSRAVFKIIHYLGSFWKLLLIFRLLPTGFNDRLYDLIAKNRYWIFGRSKDCLIRY